MRWSIAALALALSGCTTRPPPLVPVVAATPAAPLNIVGDWTAVAIDGVPTDVDDRFPLTITPTTTEARLCNTLRGGYRTDAAGIVRPAFWTNTEMGCFDPTGKSDPMATEERVFAILYAQIDVLTPTPDTLRLTSPRGSIDFKRGSPLSHAIVGEWTAVAFDGRPADPADRFSLTITPTMLRAHLCNDVYGHYRIAGSRIEAVGPGWPRTERGCGAPAQRLEDRAWAVLGASPTMTMFAPDRMRITNAHGSIDFERRPRR